MRNLTSDIQNLKLLFSLYITASEAGREEINELPRIEISNTKYLTIGK